MPSTRPTRSRVLAAGVLAGALATGACSVTSDTFSCDVDSCSVTLTGDGAEVEVFGTPLAFGGVQDGRATLEVGEVSLSCAEGETVSAGVLSLQCTSVQDGSVELTASLS